MRYPTQIAVPPGQPGFIHVTALAVFLAAANPAMPLLAQGIDNEESIDAIVDAPVATEEKRVDEEQDRIVAAIENSRATAAEVRKLFTIDKLDIVFVPELAEEGSPLGAEIDEHGEALDELRTAIESSALFYHAIDSRSVLLRNVVGVEFGKRNDVTVFAAGKDPEG
ncbi:MAG: hypothetical protein JJ913_18700 [Rhizobiaceae bacterium]|nr:hypothetical protein [Rhizobiaceae bacterium]